MSPGFRLTSAVPRSLLAVRSGHRPARSAHRQLDRGTGQLDRPTGQLDRATGQLDRPTGRSIGSPAARSAHRPLDRRPAGPEMHTGGAALERVCIVGRIRSRIEHARAGPPRRVCVLGRLPSGILQPTRYRAAGVQFRTAAHESRHSARPRGDVRSARACGSPLPSPTCNPRNAERRHACDHRVLQAVKLRAESLQDGGPDPRGAPGRDRRAHPL
jgi:hypothetical protein